MTTHLALRSFVVFAPKMLGILVDTDQQDSYGDDCAPALLGVVLEFIAECGYGADGKDCALAPLGLVLVFMSVAVHLQGRLHPVVAQRLFPWLRLFSRPSRFSCCSSLTRFDVSVVQDQQVPWVQAWRRQPSPTLHSFSGADVEKTVELPQLQYIDKVVDVPVVVRNDRCRDGPDSAENCGVSAVGADFRTRLLTCPCWTSRGLIF